MHDLDIRLALHALLLRTWGDADTRIRHELGLSMGKRRIDVAVINNELVGYESKSDEDTLIRLTAQAGAYGRVFDRVILVTTQRHLDGANAMLPPWWGIIVAHNDNGIIHLEDVRAPTLNNQYDAFSLAQLLWRAEALEELRLRGQGRGLSKKARYYIWTALAKAVPLDELRSIVRTRLRSRRKWSGGRLRLSKGL